MTLSGSVNKRLVTLLQNAGARACGLSGVDGSTFVCRPLDPDLGRVGAVAQIAVEDVTYAPDGGAEVKIFRHKTTQQNKPIRKQISPALVARLQAWLALTGIDAGPVFRPLAGRRNQLKNLPPTALSTNAIRAAMKRCMARIGVADLGLIGGHSTRIGGALDLMEHGCTLDELMRHGNWHGTAMPLRYTQRHTDAVNPIHRILSGSKPIDSAGEA